MRYGHPYSAAKFGRYRVDQTLAKELGREIVSTAILPGIVVEGPSMTG